MAVRQTGFPARIYFDIALADVNGDRRDDLVTSCGDVFLRMPYGSLSGTPSFRLAAPPGEPKDWVFLAAGDFDGDAIPDLVLAARGQGPGACVLTGSRIDGLSAARTIVVKLGYVPQLDTRFGVADFDGDGKPDLAGFGPSPTGATGVHIRLQGRAGPR